MIHLPGKKIKDEVKAFALLMILFYSDIIFGKTGSRLQSTFTFLFDLISRYHLILGRVWK